jgi:hypothetical protein
MQQQFKRIKRNREILASNSANSSHSRLRAKAPAQYHAVIHA